MPLEPRTVTRLKLLVRARPDGDPADLRRALAAMARQLDGAGGGRATVLADGHRAGLDRTPHGEAIPGRFDAMLDLVLADDADVDADGVRRLLRGSGERLAPLVDATRSAALVGTDHIVHEGTGAATLVVVLARAPITPERFRAHWLEVHGALVAEGRADEPGGYRQLHCDADLSRAAADATGLTIADYDGVAEGDFDDGELAVRTLADAPMLRAALLDERNFVDHGRSAISVMTRADRP